MTSSLCKSGMMKFGIGLIALTVAASVQAKTLVYCSWLGNSIDPYWVS